MSITRPSYRDPEILAVVARAILAEMPPDTVTEGEEESALSDIVKALHDEAPGFDAYRLAKNLDDRGWICDREIVEAFEIASGQSFQAVREATEQWVRTNSIRPRLGVGDQVKRLMTRHHTFSGKRAFDGEVVAVDAEHATYTVMIPALGHVRDGVGVHGTVINFEELHSIVAPVEEFQLS